MTILEQFVQDRLDRAKCTSDIDFREMLFCQAFGAIEFACLLYPKHEDEIAKWWNDNKRKEFWDIIGG